MHNEELIRRSAELKARMLAQRNADAREQSSSTTRKRKSVKREPHSDDSVVDDVNALKKHIAQLDAENERLRRQLTVMSTRTTEPSRSSEDSIPEQRHNFFKYSNIRQY
jgi:hypothetical protein